MRRVLRPVVRGIAIVGALTVVLFPGGYLEEVLAQAATFIETFAGTPASPLPWSPVDWDVTVLGANATSILPMNAQHGPDCSPPPATHPIVNIQDTVFICNNHLMTAMNNGYGAIYLTPNRVLDFSQGEAVLKWDMSTARTSSRDWVDVVLMPFDENEQVNFQDVHNPQDAVHLELAGGNGLFVPTVWRNYVSQQLSADVYHTWDMIFANVGLTASATRRDTFELHLSRTHLKFMFPGYNFTWIDTDISPSLSWSQAVIQLNHRSYNPEKACNFDGTCGPNTWHWGNVSVSPAAPFTILHADRRFVDGTTSAQVNFPAAAPTNSHLRFAGGGKPIEFSVDNGATWTSATVQGIEAPADNPAMGDAFWSPVPAGTRSVLLRGTDHGTVKWGVQDISIWAPGQGVIIATQTPVVGNVAAATPTPSPTATASASQPTATSVPTASPTPVVVLAPQTPSAPSAPSASSSGSSGGSSGSSSGGGGGGSHPSQSSGGASVAQGSGGGGSGSSAGASVLAFVALPTPFPSPTPVPDLSSAPVLPLDDIVRANLPADGGPVQLDVAGLTLAVPALSLQGDAAVAEVRRAGVDGLPSPPSGMTFGQRALNVSLTTPTGEDAVIPRAPIAVSYQPSVAEWSLAQFDLSRIHLVYLAEGGWIALTCGPDATASGLTCDMPQVGMIAVMVAPAQDGVLDRDIAGGHFFREANGFGGAGDLGFPVVDDGAAPFWSEFKRLGGVERLGYPISQRFQYKGYLTQAFQKLTLQWRPDSGQAVPLNVFDELALHGSDAWLETRQVPRGQTGMDDPSLSWEEVVARHTALLNGVPGLSDFFAADSNAIDEYGLPVAVQSYGNVTVVRLQRATLQVSIAGDGTATGINVTVGNGGDLAREAGLWPNAALVPEQVASAAG